MLVDAGSARVLYASPVIRIINKVFFPFNLDAILVFLSIACGIFLIGFALKFYLPDYRRAWSIIITVAGLLFLLGFVAAKEKLRFINRAAVVIVKDVEAKFEPITSATAYFSLKEGALLEVLESSSDWYKIRRADSKIGWINKNSIRKINGNDISDPRGL